MTVASLKDTDRQDRHALYRSLILEHARSPRNFGRLEAPSHRAEGINPLCGDKLELTLAVDDHGRITDVAFEGTGCAISMASASILTETITGQSVAEARALFERFKALLDEEHSPTHASLAEPLRALAGVRDYPSRIKCATLAWQAMVSATDDRGGTPVTTE